MCKEGYLHTRTHTHVYINITHTYIRTHYARAHVHIHTSTQTMPISLIAYLFRSLFKQLLSTSSDPHVLLKDIVVSINCFITKFDSTAITGHTVSTDWSKGRITVSC